MCINGVIDRLVVSTYSIYLSVIIILLHRHNLLNVRKYNKDYKYKYLLAPLPHLSPIVDLIPPS